MPAETDMNVPRSLNGEAGEVQELLRQMSTRSLIASLSRKKK